MERIPQKDSTVGVRVPTTPFAGISFSRQLSLRLNTSRTPTSLFSLLVFLFSEQKAVVLPVLAGEVVSRSNSTKGDIIRDSLFSSMSIKLNVSYSGL